MEERNNDGMKIVGMGRFILSIIVSFVIWDFVFGFIFDFLLQWIINFNNSILSLVGSFTIWLLKSVVVIILTYFNNRKIRVAKYQLEKAKVICLIIFYFSLIGLNITELMNGFISSPIIWSFVTIIHIFLIAFINEIMYKREIHSKKSSLIVCFIVIFILALIVTINFINVDKMSTLTCIRKNNDKVVFKVDDHKIVSIVLNGKKLSSDQIKEYCSLNGSKCYYYSLSSFLSDEEPNFENRKYLLKEIKYFEEYRSNFYSKCN